MKIAGEHLSSLEALGYTPDEARFLYIAATHSGYFITRQFLSYSGRKSGSGPSRFMRKVQGYGDGAWREYPHTGGVYRLGSRRLYRVIEKEQLGIRHRHSAEFIRTRLVQLDFVLANQTHHYLETEAQKVAYFCDTLGLAKDVLPVQAYGNANGTRYALRYFPDKFPLFLDSSGTPGVLRPTFSYVDAGEITLGRFRRHLLCYRQLFTRLPDFRFLYISNSIGHFAAAERCFQSFLARLFQPQANALEEMLRYFELRKAWQQERYGSLSDDDIEWLREAKERLKGPDTERLYSEWARGEPIEGAFAGQAGEVPSLHRFDFGVYLVPSGAQTARELAKVQ